MNSYSTENIKQHRNIIFVMCAVPIMVIALVTSVLYYVNTSNNDVDAALIYNTGFENGSLSEWGGGQCMRSYSCTASTTSPRQGSYSSRYEIRDGDCPITGDRCYGERAERQGGAIGNSFSSSQGQNRWYSWSMKFENGFPNSTRWQVISQWHSSSNGSPAVAFYISGRTMYMQHYSPSRGYVQHYYSTLNTGQWYDLKMNINWSSNSDGYVRLWINNQEQPRYNGSTLRAGEGTYFKQGYYRDENVSGTGIVYYDNLKAATSEADLGGTPSSPPPPAPTPPPPAPTPPPPTGTQSPYSAANKSLPGRIEAEHYDNGGQNVAYYDTTTGNQPGQLRSDSVDIETSGEGGYNVGWNNVGEWREHTVTIQEGSYNISARVASELNGGQLNIKLDGQTIGTLNVPNTGDWQGYQTVTLNNINLGGGSNKVLRFETLGNDYTINWVNFARLSDPTPPPPPSPNPNPSPQPSPPPTTTTPNVPKPPTPVSGANPETPIAIPETLEPETDGSFIADFDNDGLNDVVFDNNNDGLIDPKSEIAIYGSQSPQLTSLSGPIGFFAESNLDDSTLSFKAGPLPEVKMPKFVAYTFVGAQGVALTGLGIYLAIIKLSLFAAFRSKMGL